MNRKNFIRLSGASLGGLIFKSAFSEPFETGHAIAMPDGVWIQSLDKWYQLKSSTGNKYVYEDVNVTLQPKAGVLSVLVSSPKNHLSAVRLNWNTGASKGKTLVDHWERTYGDVSWQAPVAGKKMPWYFIQHDDKGANCFGVKTGCNTIAYWNVDNRKVQLTLDTQSGGSGVELGTRTLHATDIITTKSRAGETLFTTARRFCKLMCDKARLPNQPVYGINDWYFTYGNNSYDLIVQITSLMTGLATDTNNRPFSVVDAGWATYSPLLPGDCCWQDDYSKPNEHFKDMAKLGAEIKKLGMRPGLWTRPLCGKHDDKANLILPSIPGRDDAKKPVLDPTIDENIARIKSNIALYNQWGFDMVKHDFSTYDIMGKWGFEMENTLTAPGWSFNDKTRTNAEVILHLYKSIREAAGDMYLIGCNTLSHLSAGLFELNRVGDDTSGKEWDRTRKMGVNTLGFRMPQHRTFYEADGDCVGLTNSVPWEKNKQWMQLVAESSTPLFISLQPDVLGAEQKQYIKQSFSTAAKVLPVGQPLDWLETPLPAKWKLNGKVVNFDWS